MNKKIYIINGSGGVGKDTFISFVSDCLKSDYGFLIPVLNVSSIDVIKQMARLIGWQNQKGEKDRKFLSDLKLLSIEYNDAPFEYLRSQVKFFQNSDSVVMFMHIREPTEIEKAKKAFNAETVLIKRDNIPHISSNMADGNVFNYDYDIVVDNNLDIQTFAMKAMLFVRDAMNGKMSKTY